MSVLLSTEPYLPNERLEAWRDIVTHAFVPLEPTAPSEECFAGQVRQETIGPVSFCAVEATSQRVRRTQRLIARAPADHYKVGLQVRGCGMVEQDGRQAVLRPGDFAIYDTTRPYRLAFGEFFEMLVLMFPKHLLRLPADAMAGVTATSVPGDTGVGGLTSTFIRQLSAQIDTVSADSLVRLSNSVLDLLCAVYAEHTTTRPAEGVQRALLLRVKSFIETRLGDPELSPESVAAAHNMSVRYLYKLFEAQDESVARYIRARRLERCRHDLGDPSGAGVAVSAVASRWGLPDAAHFSKMFKAEFGQSPTDYRQSACDHGQAPCRVEQAPRTSRALDWADRDRGGGQPSSGVGPA